MSTRDPNSIVVRMEDCLGRTLQHFTQLNREHSEALTAIQQEGADAEAILVRLEEVIECPKTLSDEYWILKREWDESQDISEQERSLIQGIGQDVQALSEQLKASYEQLAAIAQKEAQSLSSELNDLKHKSGIVHKYRPGGDEERHGLDSQA